MKPTQYTMYIANWEVCDGLYKYMYSGEFKVILDGRFGQNPY